MISTRVRGAVAIGLTLSIALDTVVQLLAKSLVARVPDGAEAGAWLDAVLADGWTAPTLVGLMAWQLVNWLWVLSAADLSFALPVSSLSYATVLAASHALYGERLDAPKLAGLACVLVGAWLVTGSRGASATR